MSLLLLLCCHAASTLRFFGEQKNIFKTGSKATFNECTNNKILSNNEFPEGFQFSVSDSCFNSKSIVEELEDELC